MTRPWILDLFAGAGGAAKGYFDAGFDLIGVDTMPWGRYPYQFRRGDVFTVGRDLLATGWFAAVHASPPCKRNTTLSVLAADHHRDVIPETRAMLIESGLPYVIENVEGAPLHDPTTLCGSMFALGVRRHRLFETNWALTAPPCDHEGQDARSPGYEYKRAHGRVSRSTVVVIHGTGSHGLPIAARRQAMGIDWMSSAELTEAVPPAYTFHIGRQLLKAVSGEQASAA